MDHMNPFQAANDFLQELESRVNRLEKLAQGKGTEDVKLPPVLGVEQIVQFLGCSEYAAREIMKSKTLKTFRVGMKYQVTRKNFLEWMESGGEIIGPKNG